MLSQVAYHGENAQGKTIARATLDYDTVRLIFTDGTFINAELRQANYEDSAGIYHDEIVVKSNLAGGTTNPWEARTLLQQGIITQAEHDAFCAEYAEQTAAADANKGRRERAEFERLKKLYGDK